MVSKEARTTPPPRWFVPVLLVTVPVALLTIRECERASAKRYPPNPGRPQEIHKFPPDSDLPGWWGF
jgi:hypothetical protein